MVWFCFDFVWFVFIVFIDLLFGFGFVIFMVFILLFSIHMTDVVLFYFLFVFSFDEDGATEQWTLRMASGRALDSLAQKSPDEVLACLLPLLDQVGCSLINIRIVPFFGYFFFQKKVRIFCLLFF